MYFFTVLCVYVGINYVCDTIDVCCSQHCCRDVIMLHKIVAVVLYIIHTLQWGFHACYNCWVDG